MKVTNLCPECPAGHHDLSDEAFAALADPVQGRVSVAYRAVRNPAVGPLTLQVKDGSNPFWLAVRIDNHGNPLRSVEIASRIQGFRPMTLQDYGHWLDDNGAGIGPFRVRVTDELGHTTTVTGIDLSPGDVQDTGVRLYTGGSAVPAPAPVTRTTRAMTPAAERTTTGRKAASAPARATASRAASASPATTTPTPTAGTPTAGAAAATAPASC